MPHSSPIVCDFLIIGGGIVGLTIAGEVRRRYPGARVIVLEKEAGCGKHASGRNSGVLHAGFYYSANTLKARFTREGNRRWTAFCLERGLPIRRCGKLVVARDAAELTHLDELVRRAAANDVAVETVTAEEARRVEPRARTFERALLSPDTSSVDPTSIIRALCNDLARARVEVWARTAYRGKRGRFIVTTGGTVDPGFVINAAGLHADRIAQDFGFGERYRILPFRGLYLYAPEGPPPVRMHIYPVPDLRMPFLGVHFTVTVHGSVKIGPTAVPAFWREQYGGLRGFALRDLFEIGLRESTLLATNAFGFRTLAAQEIRKQSRAQMCRQAGTLVSGGLASRGWRWGPAGIRAQLLDVRRGQLVMDFLVEGDDRSCHVLNAVSPAFTSALPFADYVVDKIEQGAAHADDVRPAVLAALAAHP